MKWLLLFGLGCGRPPLPATNDGELHRLAQTPGARIVWIGAHPDDETILAGALWSLACRNGAICDFIVVNDGRDGDCGSVAMTDGECPCPPLQRQCPTQMGAARIGELAAAAEVFGASMRSLDPLPGAAQAPSLADTFASVIADHPAVIVTHAPTGGYGHPIHKAVGQAVLAMWRALPRADQPVLAQALDLSPASVDQPPVTDTISGDEMHGSQRLWSRVRTALHCFVTQVAAENSLTQAHAVERSSFRLLHPGE